MRRKISASEAGGPPGLASMRATHVHISWVECRNVVSRFELNLDTNSAICIVRINATHWGVFRLVISVHARGRLSTVETPSSRNESIAEAVKVLIK